MQWLNMYECSHFDLLFIQVQAHWPWRSFYLDICRQCRTVLLQWNTDTRKRAPRIHAQDHLWRLCYDICWQRCRRQNWLVQLIVGETKFVNVSYNWLWTRGVYIDTCNTIVLKQMCCMSPFEVYLVQTCMKEYNQFYLSSILDPWQVRMQD